MDGELRISRLATRASASPLAGATVARNSSVYLFLDSPLAALSVRFTLDGAPVRVESTAPWDFAGGGTTTAYPYVVSVPAGQHVVGAVLTRPNGTTTTFSATFTVTP